MNDEPHVIVVTTVIKSPFAVSTEDGDAIFKAIDNWFRQDKSVVLDFNNVDIIVSTFFNASIGQLYGYYDSEFLKDHLLFKNLSDDDAPVLVKVIERAKEYFKNKDSVDDFLNQTFSDGE